MRDRLIDELKSHNATNRTLLNLPDNFEGVYMFRNGFQRCLNKNNVKCKVDHILTQEILKNQTFSAYADSHKLIFKTKPGSIYTLSRQATFITKNVSKTKVELILQKKKLGEIRIFNGRNLKSLEIN